VKKTLPYGRQWIDEDDVEAVVAALRSDWLTTGPRVEDFEAAFAAKVGARFAVAVSSGTAALHLACLAAGVNPEGAVISTANTFVASVNCVLYCGARPVLVDIDSATLNLDPAGLSRLLADWNLKHRPQAIIPVHFAGQPCAMAQISAIARAHDIAIIEDACHALGSLWQESDGTWRSVGSCSHSELTAFSFHPVKHITTAEGGAITTNRADLYEKLKELRNHGIVRDPDKLSKLDGPWYYEINELGYNYRLSDLQCALGLSQLRKLDKWVQRRRELAFLYDRKLAGLAGLKIPPQPAHVRSSYHLYVVQVAHRPRVYEMMHQHGVKVQVHYPLVHMHPLYQKRFGFRRGDFPKTEAYYESTLSLPLFPQMHDDDVDYVVEALRIALAA
jgi:perosamine synthetase